AWWPLVGGLLIAGPWYLGWATRQRWASRAPSTMQRPPSSRPADGPQEPGSRTTLDRSSHPSPPTDGPGLLGSGASAGLLLALLLWPPSSEARRAMDGRAGELVVPANAPRDPVDDSSALAGPTEPEVVYLIPTAKGGVGKMDVLVRPGLLERLGEL